MDIKGIVFVGTATTERTATTEFFRTAFGLEPSPLDGFPAEIFSFPDGSSLGVVGLDDPERATRTIGFEVADLDGAVQELRAKGIDVGDVGESPLGRYVHLWAPDGRLYELVEMKPR